MKSKGHFEEEIPKSDCPENPTYGPVRYKDTEAVYRGQYFEGKRNGYGEEIYTDGSGYFGLWKEDKKEGKGMICSSNGNVYFGDIKKETANSQKGTLYLAYTKSKIEGEFQDGLAHGEGVESFRDGSYYSGNFFKGEKIGKGEFYFSDGSKYEGSFKEGKAEGKGIYTYPNGKSVYTGDFKDNVQNGYGELVSATGITYKGQFKDGKKNGNGELVWEDGRKIVGNFENGKYYGECKFVSAEGKEKWAECKDSKKIRWIRKRKEN